MNALVVILAIIGGVAIVAVVSHFCNKACHEWIDYKFWKDSANARLQYLDKRLNETRSWCEDLQVKCSKLEEGRK